MEPVRSSKRFKRCAPVRAFYDMNKHPEGYRYIRVENKARDPTQPTIGLSTGWFPATVAEEYDGVGEVLVKLHGFFDDPYGVEPEPVVGLAWRVDPDLVLDRKMSPVTIDLSLVVVRYKYYYTRKTSSRSHDILNENLINDVLEGRGSFKEFLGKKGNYEVFTIFAETGEHLDSIQVSDLAGLRGKRKAALYFLWPTQKKLQEAPREPGMVSASSLRSLMDRLEGAEIATCWPHPSTVYYDLVSKSWAARECERLEFNIPPTTSVSKEQLTQLSPPGSEPAVAASAAAITRLQELSRQRGQTPRGKEDYRGVVKLGFSWMGQQVLPFVGEASLQRALSKLLEGASPEAHCLVQERVEGVRCEMRAFCCKDAVNGTFGIKLRIMKMKPPQHQVWEPSFTLADHKTMTPDELGRMCFDGDRSLVQEVEDEVNRLANEWLNWFRERHSEPHQIRMDFLISTPRKGDGQHNSSRFHVHTCELTECGGSTCGLEPAPRTVAVVNQALGSTEGFPKPLPPFAEVKTIDMEKPHVANVKERPDRKKPQAKDEVQAHRSPWYGYSAMIYAVLAILWPRLRKVGNAHRNGLLMSALPLIYKISLCATIIWGVRDRLRDSPMSSN